MGFSSTIFEGDAQALIQDVNSSLETWTSYGQVVKEVRYQMQKWFLWKIKFIQREGNTIAHQLGKIGLTVENEQIWIEEVPVSILSSFLKDKPYFDYY